MFRRSPTGRLVPTIGGAFAFVPNDLPRALELGSLAQAIARSHAAIGELNGLGDQLPNPFLLISPLQHREALVSSRMEGTITGYPELLLLEAGADNVRNRTDALEVSNYVEALRTCIAQLETMPVSARLIRNAHQILLRGLPSNRAGSGTPGEFKTAQNYIGTPGRPITDARFVPPPPQESVHAMTELERFIHAKDFAGYPPLVHAALVHYQFETIHPFPDGNGRIGRLVAPLLLLEKRVLRQPLLYLSPILEIQKSEYMDRMLSVSRDGTWRDWLAFFLRAAELSAENAIATIRELQKLRRAFHDRVRGTRASVNLSRVVDFLFEKPAVSIPMVQQQLGTTYGPAKNHVDTLLKARVLRTVPLKTHPSFFIAQEIISVLERGPAETAEHAAAGTDGKAKP